MTRAVALSTLPPIGIADATSHGFDAWLDALPHAAAVVCADGAGIAVSARNQRFASQFEPRGRYTPEAAVDQACRDVLSGASSRASLIWDQGGFAGHVYEVAVARLGALESGEVLLSLVDRTTLMRSEANLRRELRSDSLTGLPNRGGFADLLEQRVRQRPPSGHALSLLIIDLCRFSRINESIGALSGDELLLTVARRLCQQTRGSDVLARIGGDEFAILSFTRPSDDGGRKLAERMRAAFATPFRIGDLMINIDCAVGGIAELARITASSDPDAHELIRQAQIALKQAKRGEGVAFYEPVSLARLHVRFDRETALRKAIEDEAITLAFQPLVNLKARQIVGFEALARWTLDGETIPPSEFVPIAEDSGLIVPLGRLIVDQALRTLAQWDSRHGEPVPLLMSINVSPIQLARDDIVSVIRERMARNAIGGDRLMVEITESCVVENPDAAHDILSALNALDVRVAMDDFGTGFSNIASLQRLPIDTLKIDRSLVAAIETNTDSLAIVRTIQRLAEALGMKTTAEGIETDTVAQQIAAIGCDTGQGYLFSRPLDADAAYAAWKASVRR